MAERSPRNSDDGTRNLRIGSRLFIRLENTGPDNTTNIGKDDIVLDVKKRMGQYVAGITATAPNQYPIDGNSYSEQRLRDDNNYPAALTDPGTNNQPNYSADIGRTQQGRTAIAEFKKSSNSGQLDIDNSPFRIKKGKLVSDAPTGTDILNDVNQNRGNSSFGQRIRIVQENNNRFSEDKPYVGDGSGIKENDSNLGISLVQRELGKHAPRKFPNSDGKDPVVIKLLDLKKIGLLTLLESTGEIYIPSDPTSAVQNLAARGASLVPGLGRLGQKIGVNRLNPINIMKKINPDFEKPQLEDNIKKDELTSYGGVNNWLVPFSGLSSTASIASAALLLLTVGGLLKAVSLLFSPHANRSFGSFNTGDHASPAFQDRRQRIGSYLGKANTFDPLQNGFIQLDVYQTRHSFYACVSRGIDIFFGFQDGASIVSNASKIAKNHGYYNTVLRSVIRSTSDFLKDGIGTVVNTNSSGAPSVGSINDVTLFSNPLGTLELIQKFNESKLLKFVNILAAIGDTALNHEEAGYEVTVDGEVDAFISDVDNINEELPDSSDRLFVTQPLNPAILQAKSRLSDKYRNSLAWGQGTVKSMYMFPEDVLKGVSTFIGSVNQINNIDTVSADLLAENNVIVDPGSNANERLAVGRIDAESVRKMEEYLEADYMPFYFQDLRTNEIISFHAFLENVNDSFDADYNEVEGYGRIGSVPIYKNTKRSISVDFRIVSTNSKDFDHMWWKINKLVTLVYPQYTMGRQVGAGNNKFIQPFSQLPGASPLIRFRLGDLFKTNYSSLSVARLFGIDSGQFQLEGVSSGSFHYQRNLADARVAVGKRMSHGEFRQGEQALLAASYVSGHGRRQTGYPRADDGATNVVPNTNTRRGRVPTRAPLPETFTTIPNSVRGSFGRGPSLVTAIDVPVVVIGVVNSTRIQANESIFYRVRLVNPSSGQDGIYIVNQSNLHSQGSEITRVANAQVQGTNQSNPATTTPQAIQTFFGKGNPIIKSFKSTQGKGLAGVIKSLKFDFADSRWVTDRVGARAPMSMKLTFDFHPIHDINPGLDHNGFNIAPIYNIGETMKTFNKENLPGAADNTEFRFTTANAAFVPRITNGNDGDNR